jgi:hypothetical protein
VKWQPTGNSAAEGKENVGLRYRVKGVEDMADHEDLARRVVNSRLLELVRAI